LKAELEWIASAAGEVATVPTAVVRYRRLPWIAAAIAISVAAGTSWIAYRVTRPTELKPLVRLDVDLGSDVSLGSNAGAGASAIISPDGTRLVYVSQGKLHTRKLDQLKATELAGTDGAFGPFFSPDGRWVAFFAQGKLRKVSVDGGSAIAICDYEYNPRGGGWGEDGNIIAALVNGNGLSRIPSEGGRPTPVTELEQGEKTHRWPQILPGGKAVLFTSHTATLAGFDGASIVVMSLRDRRRKTLVRGGTFGRYLPSGHLIYVSRGTLFAVPFDLETLAVRGAPAPVFEQIAYSTQDGSAQLDFSPTGTLVYQSGRTGGGLVTVEWLDSAGKAQPLLAKPGDYNYPGLSPDGQRLALIVTVGSDQDIWVYEWQRDTMTRLTFGGTPYTPAWSPDGRYILFQASEGMFWTRSDGSGNPQRLIQNMTQGKFLYPSSFTPDGKRLAFYEGVTPAGDIWTVPVESDGAGLRAGKPEPFLQTAFNEREPAFAPDGRWLAYVSDESGTMQVYVRAFPAAPFGKGGKWQVSNDGGRYPTWSRNGRELFFRTEDNRIMVATYTVKGDSFTSEKPRVWSAGRIARPGRIGRSRNFDLAPNGNRIAALIPVDGAEEQKAQNHVIFLENFFDELRRGVAAGK